MDYFELVMEQKSEQFEPKFRTPQYNFEKEECYPRTCKFIYSAEMITAHWCNRTPAQMLGFSQPSDVPLNVSVDHFTCRRIKRNLGVMYKRYAKRPST